MTPSWSQTTLNPVGATVGPKATLCLGRPSGFRDAPGFRDPAFFFAAAFFCGAIFFGATFFFGAAAFFLGAAAFFAGFDFLEAMGDDYG